MFELGNESEYNLAKLQFLVSSEIATVKHLFLISKFCLRDICLRFAWDMVSVYYLLIMVIKAKSIAAGGNKLATW